MKDKRINFKPIIQNYGRLSSIISYIVALLSTSKFTYDFVYIQKYYYLLWIFIPICALLIFWFRQTLLNIYIISKVIRPFYENIGHNNTEKERYKISWQLLSKDLQNDKWNNDFDSFRNGYTYTEKVNVVKVVL